VCSVDGNYGGADTIAMREGGESENVSAERLAEGGSFGFAQCGEFSCRVDHRTVVLAQLDRRTVVVFNCGGVTRFGQARRDGVDGRFSVNTQGRDEAIGTLLCKGSHGVGARASIEESQNLDREGRGIIRQRCTSR
jgi:hypothetical protein